MAKSIKLKLPKAKYQLANPLKRIAAFLLDLLLLQMLVISAFNTYFESLFPTDKGFIENYQYLTNNINLFSNAYYALITIAVLMILYFAYMEYKFSQTVGMMIFRIYAKSSEEKELTFFQCVLRNIYLLPLFPTFFLWVIDPLYFMFKGERLSEIFSKTKTVEEVISYEKYL